MDYAKLGQSDLMVSSIGLGCVTFGREIDEETSRTVMDHAIERGLTLFDTAMGYNDGASEEVIGRWMAKRSCRESVVLATKVSGTLNRKHVLASCEASLRRLRSDTIDLYLMHNFDPHTPLKETLEALDTLVKHGKVRAIGCSNISARQLAEALWLQKENGWARFESVQPVYNMVARQIELELMPLCREQQLGVVSYSPLGAGFLTGKYHPDKPFPKGSRFDTIPGHTDVYYHPDSWQTLDALRLKSKELGISMVQLALAWVFAQPDTSSILVGARAPAHIDQALEAKERSRLPELSEELSTLPGMEPCRFKYRF